MLTWVKSDIVVTDGCLHRFCQHGVIDQVLYVVISYVDHDLTQAGRVPAMTVAGWNRRHRCVTVDVTILLPGRYPEDPLRGRSQTVPDVWQRCSHNLTVLVVTLQLVSMLQTQTFRFPTCQQLESFDFATCEASVWKFSLWTISVTDWQNGLSASTFIAIFIYLFYIIINVNLEKLPEQSILLHFKDQ